VLKLPMIKGTAGAVVLVNTVKVINMCVLGKWLLCF